MPQPQTSSAEILIVDHSPKQAAALGEILEAHGYRVRLADSTLNAIQQIISATPDLVISEILLPGVDGFQLCRQIRAIESIRCLPVILLTHLNDPNDVLHSLAAGADYCLSKPCNEKVLLPRIAATLERHGACFLESPDGSVTVRRQGHEFHIEAPKAQIIELLLATFELASEKNQELILAQQALYELNQELEQRVEDRTQELVAETAERLQAVQGLRQRDELLMRQSRQAAMGEMIGNIAHQWRQPLNAVGLLVQDIALCYEYDNFSKEYLDTSTKKIMKLVRHMSQTIDDFRNFIGSDKEKVRFSVGATVAKTLHLVQGSLTDKGIEVLLEEQETPELVGYPTEFSQVLLNILTNAKDVFLERKVPTPRVQVRVGTEQGRAVVTITDNAGGVPDAIIGRIFEPYFTTKEQGKGTGIGLFMSKRIVEQTMNGSLTVRNTGQGAEFRIEV